jgi:hypothetical protein
VEKEVIAALIGAVALVIVALLRSRKHKAEVNKLAAETKEIQRKPIEADRKVMLDLLNLLKRAAFHPDNQPRDPTATFKAIRDTRIALQKGGASSVPDKDVAERFQQIQDQLLQIENKVIDRHPAIADLASRVADLPLDTSERTSLVRETLRDKYDGCVAFMKEKLDAIDLSSAAQGIEQKIRDLDVPPS